MGSIVKKVTKVLGLSGDEGKAAAKASLQGAQLSAGAQREALDYLKEREALPRQFSEGALKGLAGLYGLPGGEGDQQALIEQAMASPLYQSLMGGRKEGEEAILRSAAATGGLRSGGTIENLADFNTQLQNQALLQAYQQQVQGLQGLAGLPSMAPQIAQSMAGIGETLGQGKIAAAQAKEAGAQQGFGNLMGLGQLGLTAYGLGMFSDRRLKDDIKRIGEINGHSWYQWTWNKIANALGLTGECQGCMADEVYSKSPKSVILKDGFLFVIYDELNIFPKMGVAA